MRFVSRKLIAALVLVFVLVMVPLVAFGLQNLAPKDGFFRSVAYDLVYHYFIRQGESSGSPYLDNVLRYEHSHYFFMGEKYGDPKPALHKLGQKYGNAFAVRAYYALWSKDILEEVKKIAHDEPKCEPRLFQHFPFLDLGELEKKDMDWFMKNRAKWVDCKGSQISFSPRAPFQWREENVYLALSKKLDEWANHFERIASLPADSRVFVAFGEIKRIEANKNWENWGNREVHWKLFSRHSDLQSEIVNILKTELGMSNTLWSLRRYEQGGPPVLLALAACARDASKQLKKAAAEVDALAASE